MYDKPNKLDIVETINHYKSLQKRFTKQHNGTACKHVNLALVALEEYLDRHSMTEDAFLDSILD